MRIDISGPSEAFDIKNGEKVEDAKQLQKLDGLLFDEDLCANYFENDSLADIGIQGGRVRLTYNRKDGLTVVTSYHSPRELKPAELKKLMKFTESQWSDGIGENEFQHRQSVGLDVSIWLTDTKSQITAEQIDDGVDIPPPPPIPLIKALSKRPPESLEKLEKLIAKGADVNAQDKYGNTALHVACQNGHFSAGQFLLGHGANVKILSKSGKTPLASLATCNDKNDPEGSRNLAKAMLEIGAEIESRDEEGVTPLMWAANRANNELVEFLLASGAKANAMSDSKQTPLMFCQKLKAAEVLLRHGAHPSMRNDRGDDAADNAQRNSHWAESKSLVVKFNSLKKK